MSSLRDNIKKFDAAIQILACSDQSLRDRLDGALLEINDSDVPPDIRKEYQILIDQIRAYRESGNRSDLQSDLASSILHISIRIHRETME